jgi:hypothetical protein
MKILKPIVIALAFMLFVTGAAEAVDLFTAPLFIADADTFACEIVNVTTTSRTVRIQIIDTVGGVVSDSGDLTLPAGRVASDTAIGAAFAGSLGYCRFTVLSKNYFRGGAKIATGPGSDFVFAPAQ